MIRRVCSSLLAAMLLCVPATRQAHAQEDAGTIVGTVRDPSGSVIIGAKVGLRKITTNETFATVTNATGDYRIYPLPLGEYEIRTEFPGFRAELRTGVVLQVGRIERVDFTLTVGETTQTLAVSAKASLLSTENSAVGQIIDQQKLSDLPINNRDFASLASLSPGVVAPRGSVYGTGVASGTLTGIEVRGFSRDDNGFYLDGTLIQDGNGATSFRPNMDALQEFEIKTGLYGAEYGIRPGGQVIAVTKSGTNEYHGTASEYYRSNDLAARNFFQQKLTPYTRHQFGGTFAGPLYFPGLGSGKDRLWFMAAFQDEIIRSFVPLTGIVPTDALRNGQLPSTVRDPIAGGQPFANNLIPANRISPVSAKLMKFWPAPNTSGALNFTSPDSSADTEEPQALARVDFHHSASDRWNSSFAADFAVGLTTSAISEFSYRQPLRTWTEELTNTRTFKNRYVNVAGFHFFRRPSFLGVPAPHVADAQALGIPDLLLSRVNPTGGLPVISLTGYLSFGDSGSPPGGAAHVGNWEIKDGLSFQSGAHFIKAGGEYRRAYNLFNLAVAPGISFTTRYTGNAFGDFLLGFPSSTNTGGESLRGRFGQNSIYAYFQDDWKISSRMTLNLGLRYEARLPWKDRRGFMSNFNPYAGGYNAPALTAPLQPWQTGRFQPDVPLVEWHKTGFLPRFGVAYRASNKTAVRAGYGMYANELDLTIVQSLGGNPRQNAQVLSFNAPANAPTISVSDPFLAALATSAVPTYTGIESPLKLPITHSWGLVVERELTPNLALEIGYLGSHTSNMIETVSINDAVPGPTPRQSRRPFPAYQTINFTRPDADAWYEGMEMKLQKRPGHEGIYLLGSFTWSKTLNTMDVNTNIQGTQRTRSGNMPLDLNKANSGTDVPVRLAMTLGYELPFGKGKPFLHSGIASGLAGGWQFQSILVLQSGPWFAALLPGDPLDTGSVNSQWPNRVRNPNLDPAQRTQSRWFDTSAFAAPAPYTYGNAGRTPLQGPGLFNLDLSVQRSIRLTEKSRISLRFDAFNALNHTNFNLPGQSFGTGAFGVVGSALDSRIAQVGIKYVF